MRSFACLVLVEQILRLESELLGYVLFTNNRDSTLVTALVWRLIKWCK